MADDIDIDTLFENIDDISPKTDISILTFQIIYEKASEIWRTHFSDEWEPVSRNYHTCDGKICDMTKLFINYTVVEVSKNKSGLVQSNEFIISKNDIFNEHLIHVCVKIHKNGKYLPCKCTGLISNHADFMKTKTSLDFRRSGTVCSGEKTDAYVCERTGLVHICRPDFCEYKDNTEEKIRTGTSICCLTGNVLGEEIGVDKFWRPGSVISSAGGGTMSMKEVAFAKRILSTSSDSKFYGGIPITWADVLEDIQENLLTEMCDIDDIRSYFNRRRPRKTSQEDLAKEYYATALLRIAGLFCKTRFLLDLEAAKEARRLANRNVYKKISRSNTFVNAISLRSTQKIGMDARAVPINLLLSGKSRKNFFMMYATRCLKMWLIIRTRTQKGIDEANLFPFIDFVITIMYVFREGIKISKTVTGNTYPEIILEPDPMLKMILPRYDDVEKLDGDRTAIMKIRNEINSAITNSVKTGFTQPQDFYPDSIHISSVSLSVYTSLRKHREKRL